MDSKDRQIIRALQRDGRMTNQDLAEAVNLSPSPCLRRVRNLEASGVIRGYSADVDAAAYGIAITVIVRIRLERHNETDVQSFEGKVRRMAEAELDDPDSSEGRELQCFLRGVRKALEPAWTRAGLLGGKAKERVHLFFSDSHNGWVSTSPSALPLVEGGVLRFRLPAEAPSRSALKVEEALLRFFGSADALNDGTAVERGAAPGGGARWEGVG